MGGRHAYALLLAVLGTVACTGPAEGVVTFGESDSAQTTKKDDETDKAAEPKTTTTVPITFKAEIFPSLQPTCGSCHGAGGTGKPTFFGADATATYPLFKEHAYDKATSVLLTKGAHAGPALTDSQKSSLQKWISEEGGGGATTAADGGT